MDQVPKTMETQMARDKATLEKALGKMQLLTPHLPPFAILAPAGLGGIATPSGAFPVAVEGHDGSGSAPMATQDPENYFEGPALALAQAIQRGDLDAIRQLTPEVPLDRVHNREMTLLFYAILTKQYRAVTELIKAGADPTRRDKEIGAPLDLAVRAKQADLMAVMLDAGIDPNAQDSRGTSPETHGGL